MPVKKFTVFLLKNRTNICFDNSAQSHDISAQIFKNVNDLQLSSIIFTFCRYMKNTAVNECIVFNFNKLQLNQ